MTDFFSNLWASVLIIDFKSKKKNFVVWFESNGLSWSNLKGFFFQTCEKVSWLLIFREKKIFVVWLEQNGLRWSQIPDLFSNLWTSVSSVDFRRKKIF